MESLTRCTTGRAGTLPPALSKRALGVSSAGNWDLTYSTSRVVVRVAGADPGAGPAGAHRATLPASLLRQEPTVIRTLLAASLALAANAAAAQNRPPAARALEEAAAHLADTAQAEYDALVAEYDAESELVNAANLRVRESDEYKKAAEARDREAVNALFKNVPRIDRDAWAKRFLDAAQQHGSSPDQPLFYGWAFSNTSNKELAEAALAPLLDKHLKSEHWVEFSKGLAYGSRTLGHERTLEVLTTLADGHPNDLVKANALFGRYNTVKRATGENAPNEQQLAAAERDRKRVVELAPDSYAGMSAAAIDFERERLQIGMPVPDIQSEDTQGVEFKLSDYRGKVVVLDFWGDW
jgi:hypothetical protein